MSKCAKTLKISKNKKCQKLKKNLFDSPNYNKFRKTVKHVRERFKNKNANC